MGRIGIACGGALLSVFLVSEATAQVPAGVQPGQIERTQQVPREPAAPLEIAPPPAGPQAVPANAETIKLVLRGLRIEGATVYPESVLQTTYQADIGKEITLARIYAIAAELTARYRNDGYILSQLVVPAQSVKDGVVTLRAVEGYIHHVTIQGNTSSAALIKTYTESLKAVRPLTADALERYLLLINDIPGVSARSTLAPSSAQGAADLTLNVAQGDRTFTAGINNRNSKLLGPWRANLDADFNGLGSADHVGVRLLRTPADDELTYGTLLYDRIVSDEGLKLSVSATLLDARPQATIALPNLRSESQSASLGVSYPLIRSRLQNLSLRATFAQHNGDTDSNGAALFRDRVRALRFGAGYDLVDSLRGINLIDVEFSQGLSGMGATRENDVLASRASAPPRFRKITYYAARLQSLAPKWSLLAALNGQEAMHNLLSPEQFAFGGSDFGRGYDASDLTGDSGSAAKLEVRFADKGMDVFRDYTVYGFYDTGRIRNRNIAATPRSDRAASTGLGIRFNATHKIAGFVELAQPLNHNVVAESNRKGRVFTGLTIGF